MYPISGGGYFLSVQQLASELGVVLSTSGVLYPLHLSDCHPNFVPFQAAETGLLLYGGSLWR